MTGFFAALRTSERPAFIFDDACLTYPQLARGAARWAAHLDALGVAADARIAWFGPRSPALLTSLVGDLVSGRVHVPINTRYRGEEIRHILTDSGADVLVTPPGSEAATVAATLAKEGRGPQHIIAPEDEALTDPGAAASRPLPTEPAANALALLIYTSGTTGRSKGVALSHGALAANIGATTRLWRWSAADVLALALPLFHVHGLGLGVLGTLFHGATAIVLPRFSAAAVERAFAHHGATVFMGVPTMYHALLTWLDAAPDRARSFQSGRLFTSGSAALPAADLERFEAHTGHRILERYGMSETGFTLSNPYDGERRAGTVGQPVPGVAMRIVDDQGKVVGDGQTGELHVRTDGLMDRYWQRPNATEAALTPDGWFKTGDVVVREDGYTRIVGRSSVDIIKSGGFKISAREIEEVILRAPKVAEAAVVGVPDPKWGELIVAAVVLAPGAVAQRDALLAELSDHVGAALADFKKPRRLVIAEALPRNALGKLQKHRVKAWFT